MTGRLTWQEIQTQYPDQWVGLIEVKYLNDDGVSIESAIVKYTDLSKGGTYETNAGWRDYFKIYDTR